MKSGKKRENEAGGIGNNGEKPRAKQTSRCAERPERVTGKREERH